MFKRLGSFVVLCAGLCLGAATAQADSVTTADGYTIYYNAITSDTLDPDVAQQYGVVRSNLRGIINVGIHKDAQEGQGASVPATVKVSVASPDGSDASEVSVREISVNDSVHYLGEFPIEDEQVLDFTILVTPQGSKETTRVTLEQQFFDAPE